MLQRVASLVVLGAWPRCTREDILSSSVTVHTIGFVVSDGMHCTSQALTAPVTPHSQTPLHPSRCLNALWL